MVWIPAQPLTSCVALGKSFNLSVLQFLHLYNVDIKCSHLLGLLIKCLEQHQEHSTNFLSINSYDILSNKYAMGAYTSLEHFPGRSTRVGCHCLLRNKWTGKSKWWDTWVLAGVWLRWILVRSGLPGKGSFTDMSEERDGEAEGRSEWSGEEGWEEAEKLLQVIPLRIYRRQAVAMETEKRWS